MDYEAVKKVVRTFYRVMAVYSREFSDDRYSFTEAYLISIIGIHPGIMASEIAEFVVLNSGYLSRMLKRLEGDGLICRISSKGKMRAKYLYLTEQGDTFFAKIQAKADISVRSHMSGASNADQQAFVALMEEVQRMIEKIYPDPQFSRERIKE